MERNVVKTGNNYKMWKVKIELISTDLIGIIRIDKMSFVDLGK
jgi:hypothetical protein